VAALAPGVELVELTALLRGHAPWRVQEAVLFTAPRAVLRGLARAGGRGRLGAFVERAGGAYERRFAWRVHRRLVLPAYDRIWGSGPGNDGRAAPASRRGLRCGGGS
jgi:hypothetical protein